jgi:uncharacterized membrane protein
VAGPLDKVLHPLDQQRVIDAIKAAERLSSAELKVHVEARCPGGDPQKRAHDLFIALGLQRTRERNAVLIYVAVRDRRFAILGDSKVHEPPNAPFWADATQRLNMSLGRGAVGEGIAGAIQVIGRKLQPRFPRAADDRNEIDNEITTDEHAV